MTLAEATKPVDTTDFIQLANNAPPTTQITQSPRLSASPFLTTPLPLIAAFPDNLRQFYLDGIPQDRIIPVRGISLD